MGSKTPRDLTPIPAARYSSPLPSQSELFKKTATVDEDYSDMRRPRSRYDYEDRDERSRRSSKVNRSCERSRGRSESRLIHRGRRSERRRDSDWSDSSRRVRNVRSNTALV